MINEKKLNQPDIKLSLMLCARNNFENLKNLLDAVYAVNFAFHEVIVFDDSSEDNTSDKALYYYAEKPNFKLVTFANHKGFHTVRNEGFLRATGDYLMFLDADFLIDEKSMFALIEEAPHYNIVYPETKNFNDNYFLQFKSAHDNNIKFSHCFVMQKKSLFCFNGIFYQTEYNGLFCDFDFFSRAQVYGLSACLIKEAEVRLQNNAKTAACLLGDKASRAMFLAIYRDFAAISSVQIILDVSGKIDAADSGPETAEKTELIKRKAKELIDNNNSFYYRYRDSYPRKISDSHFTLLEITNACIKKCSHCTRGVALLKQPQHMTPEEIETALISLKDWKRGVGLFGGEPTTHPDFPRICELLEKYFPKEQRALFTCGGKFYEKYKDMIEDKFGIINYNDHVDICYHQPVFVASGEVITDKKMFDVLVQRCWVSQIYCHIITRRGGFFCEVAGTLDLMYNGNKGFKLEPGWWKKSPEETADQVNEYCYKCGMCIPLPSQPDNCRKEFMTSEQYKKLKGNISDKYLEIEIFDKKYAGMSIFDGSDSRKENYTNNSPDSFWYKENFLDTRACKRENKKLMTQ